MERIESLDEIFESSNKPAEKKSREGTPLTMWVSLETKRKYDEIQRSSGRKFSPVLKKIIETVIDRKFEADAG